MCINLLRNHTFTQLKHSKTLKKIIHPIRVKLLSLNPSCKMSQLKIIG